MKSTTEKNILIAEFMGLNLLKNTKHFRKAFENDEEYYKSLYCINEGKNNWYSMDAQNLPYHSSWDWLMLVVEKMEELSSYTIMERKIKGSFEIGAYGIKFYFNPNQNYLLHLELRPFLTESTFKHNMYKHHIIEVFDFKNRTKIEAVFEAVVSFIQWYNTQNLN